jgi:hypothetical protein
MSSVDDTEKQMLAYYREQFPALKAENERLRKRVAELEKRWNGVERRGTSVPPRTSPPGGSE